MNKLEFRTFKVELRKKEGDAKPSEITGHAAVFNQFSVDMFGWRERVMPGAFARAIKEKQDVRALINHDPNLVLGRTKSGTLELSEDKEGLLFNCDLPNTTYASDIVETLGRGDVDQCSFGMICRKATWLEEPNPEDDSRQIIVRQIEDVDLFDVSVVTYPAFEGTDAAVRSALEMRSLALADAPAEIRKKLEQAAAAEKRDSKCECVCENCQDGDCDNCTDPDCDDPNCEGSMRSRRARAIKAAQTF